MTINNLPRTILGVKVDQCPKCLKGRLFKDAVGEVSCYSCGYTVYPRVEGKKK